MSFWIEVRCDENADGRCWSSRNEGPMDSSGITVSQLKAAAERLRADAVEQGWKISRHPPRIYCPACKGRAT